MPRTLDAIPNGALQAANRRMAVAPLLPADTDLFPFTATQWDQIARTLTLTPQQTRITELILCGLKDKQIARRLELSEPTVRTHLARIFARLGVDDRVQLVLCIFWGARNARLDDKPSNPVSSEQMTLE